MSEKNEIYYYKISLQYVGTRYYGWQVQDGVPTIQGQLNKVLMEMVKSEEIKTMGSGRTDAGVHAFMQIVKLSLPIKIPPMGLLRGLNSLLPPDIRVTEASESNYDFHPIYHCREKEYNYVFSNKAVTPFAAPYLTSYLFPLDIDILQDAARIFEGTHDFKNFYCVGTEIESTSRTIFECRIDQFREEGFLKNFCSEYFVLKIVGNGFLKQMVRAIMGAIFSVARGKNTLDELKLALDGPKNLHKIGSVAPPEGLYLVKAKYSN